MITTAVTDNPYVNFHEEEENSSLILECIGDGQDLWHNFIESSSSDGNPDESRHPEESKKKATTRIRKKQLWKIPYIPRVVKHDVYVDSTSGCLLM